ncbi:MAG: TIGR02186 family protein [Syntrophobacteraceae bacterium]
MKTRYLIVIAALCVFTATSAFAQEAAGLAINPLAINMGTFYDGITLTATGSIPAGSEAVVRFLGATSEIHLKQVGKVGGLVWMNLGSVTFKDAPAVCIVSSAVDFNHLEANNLRLTGLKNSMRLDAQGDRNDDVFAEFIKLKKKEGLYREMTGNITYAKAANGQKTFRALIPLPSRLKPGTYTVDISAVQDGRIVAHAQKTLEAKLEGLPALMSAMAFNHSILYGVFASIIALLAGLGIGLVFQSKGAH